MVSTMLLTAISIGSQTESIELCISTWGLGRIGSARHLRDYSLRTKLLCFVVQLRTLHGLRSSGQRFGVAGHECCFSCCSCET